MWGNADIKQNTHAWKVCRTADLLAVCFEKLSPAARKNVSLPAGQSVSLDRLPPQQPAVYADLQTHAGTPAPAGREGVSP